ncbi:MAG: hypothetical protein R3Y16_03720, partial [Rikenellaceae bacterium]
MRRIFTILAIAAIVASCYKSELTDATCKGDEGVEVNILSPTLSDEDDSLPSSYTISIDGVQITTDSHGTVDIPLDLDYGEYYVYVYTNHDDASITDDTHEGGEGTIVVEADVENNLMTSIDDHIYFGQQKITITEDTVTSTDISLSQISRDIHFNYHISEGDPTTIATLSATLSGIAQQWECVSDMPWGDPTVIDPLFTLGESLTKSEDLHDHIIGSIRVLGINGSDQTLTIGLTLSDGSSQLEEFDLSDDLKDANSDKSTAILVSGEVKLGNADDDDDTTTEGGDDTTTEGGDDTTTEGGDDTTT